jgi:glycyl-tRNA synthetase beta chain
VSPDDVDRWSIAEILSRLAVVQTLRGRSDFARLVELTKRVDNILANAPEGSAPSGHRESHATAIALQQAHDALSPRILAASTANDFPAVIDHLSGLVAPVAKFFDDVLVLDTANPDATLSRCALLAQVRSTVTRDFDIRELAGQADTNR